MIKSRQQIEAALWVMEQAGFSVAWVPAGRPGDRHLFTASDRDTGERWTVAGDDPLGAVGELMEQCGFGDLS